MLVHELCLVYEAVNRYGYVAGLADLGGLPSPTLADYRRTMTTGRQNARYVQACVGRPFDDIDPEYQIFNPELGGPSIEELATEGKHTFGTLCCLSVLEHASNPFAAAEGLISLLAPGGLLIASTPFAFPLHGDPKHDRWRFTPAGLITLFTRDGFEILECGWGLEVFAEDGILDHTGRAQIVRSVQLMGKRSGERNGTRGYVVPRLVGDPRFDPEGT